MSELEQLKKRIDSSGTNGILTAHVREDYDPIGDIMMKDLMESGEYVQRKGNLLYNDNQWRIYKKGNEPY